MEPLNGAALDPRDSGTFPADSYYRYWRDLNTWAYAAGYSMPRESWPAEMDATVCGRWVDRALAVIGLLDVPDTVRRMLLQRLFGAAHYCDKWDRVQDYNFGNGDLELVQWLAGSYPEASVV